MLAADLVCKTALGEDFGMLNSRDDVAVRHVREMLNTMAARMWSLFPYWKIPGLARRVATRCNAWHRVRMHEPGLLLRNLS